MTSLKKEIRRKWKPRKKTSHKGDFGRVFLIAGSRGLTGAAHLASAAAVRSGAGLVTLGCPDAVYPVLARREAEVMVCPFPSTSEGSLSRRALKPILNFSRSQDAVAIGPGLSQNIETQRVVRDLVQKTKQPLVIDADGLNALKGHLTVLGEAKNRVILTPHPGEFLRLFGGRLSAREGDRKKRALEAAVRYGLIIVLKGNRTVVAEPERGLYVNSTGNPGMASGGTGDVLTGMIAALIGQKFSLWDAARFGVYLHGLAGDVAANQLGQVSFKAGDLLDFLPRTLRKTLKW